MSRAALAKIHIARKELGLDEETYRALLKRVSGKTSSANMSEAEQAKVLKEFKRLGWKGSVKTGQKSRRQSQDPQVRKVFALWGELGRRGLLSNPSRAGLRAFVRRMAQVDDPEWMNSDQANKVIEGLKAIEKRASK